MHFYKTTAQNRNYRGAIRMFLTLIIHSDGNKRVSIARNYVKNAYPNAHPIVTFRFSMHTQTHTQVHTQPRFLTFQPDENSRFKGAKHKNGLQTVQMRLADRLSVVQSAF